MANELTVYGATPNAVELIQMMGNAIQKSGMLGCENEAQGIVLAMTCFSKGSDPLSLAQRYHIIHGRLSMKSDAMLAEFRTRGGKHRIVKRTGDEAAIELSMDGDKQQFTLSWADAQQEPFVYNGKESETIRFIEAGNAAELAKRLKPKYSTPRARMQMLWARVVSDGVRAMCPEVNLGTYTPEEIDDFDETPASPMAAAKGGDPKQVAPPSASQPMQEDIVDAEYTIADDAGKITAKQLTRISELFKALAVSPEKQLASAKKRGADSVATMTEEQAADLLAGLEKRYADKLASEVGTSENASGEKTVEPIDSPCSQAKIDQIKSLIGQLVQMPGNADLVSRMQERLRAQGIERFSLLTESSATRVINALSAKNLDEFFKLDLQAAAEANAKNG